MNTSPQRGDVWQPPAGRATPGRGEPDHRVSLWRGDLLAGLAFLLLLILLSLTGCAGQSCDPAMWGSWCYPIT